MTRQWNYVKKEKLKIFCIFQPLLIHFFLLKRRRRRLRHPRHRCKTTTQLVWRRYSVIHSFTTNICQLIKHSDALHCIIGNPTPNLYVQWRAYGGNLNIWKGINICFHPLHHVLEIKNLFFFSFFITPQSCVFLNDYLLIWNEEKIIIM